ncbi:MAG: hypothetical protein NVS2B12_02890 [Ktedonobacteraceae bacterium]
MLLHPSKHVGDAWYYVKEDIMHCFYLKTPTGQDLTTRGGIGHAISTDLARWDILDLALTGNEAGRDDEVHSAIGSVLYYADRYWLAYTASMSIISKSEATVCLAVSDDLLRWEKVAYNPVTRIDPLYYQRHEPQIQYKRQEQQNQQSIHWCNPFLFYYDEWVYHYVCASRKSGPSEWRGTLGLARTQDMVKWQVLPPPILEPILQSIDVPQLYHNNGLFYLVFFAHAHHFSRDFAFEHRSDLTSTMYSMVSPTPFGPFRMIGSGRIVPANLSLQIVAAQLVHWREQHYLLCSMSGREPCGELQPVQVHFTAAGVKAYA